MTKRVLACMVAAVVAVYTLVTAAEPAVVPHGRLETLNGHTVVSVEGTPEEMGTAYGRLLGPTIQRVVKAVITDGFGKDADAYQNVLKGSKVMERFQPPEFLAELKAIAAAAKVSYDDLVLLQYFGDVRRCITGAGSASMCCSFAVLPPLTRERVCLVGRSFEYFDEGVGEYASLLAYHRPKGRIHPPALLAEQRLRQQPLARAGDRLPRPGREALAEAPLQTHDGQGLLAPRAAGQRGGEGLGLGTRQLLALQRAVKEFAPVLAHDVSPLANWPSTHSLRAWRMRKSCTRTVAAFRRNSSAMRVIRIPRS